MSSTQLVAEVALVEIDLPEGQTDGNILFTLSKPDGSVETKEVPASTDGSSIDVVFTAVVPGEALVAGRYTVTAVKLSQAGSTISTPVSATIDVPPDVIVTKIHVPVSVTLSLV